MSKEYETFFREFMLIRSLSHSGIARQSWENGNFLVFGRCRNNALHGSQNVFDHTQPRSWLIFFQAFLGKLDEHKLNPGEDVTRYAKEFGLELPALLKGANITWDGHGKPNMEAAHGRVQTMVLAQPSHPTRLGW